MAWRDWVRTVEVEPSLYAADFAHLGEQVGHLLNAGARVFHFDVGDGHFVEPITIGPIVLQAIADDVHARGGVIDASGLAVEAVGEEWPQFRHPRRPEFLLTLPHVHGTSGFFIARLRT